MEIIRNENMGSWTKKYHKLIRELEIKENRRCECTCAIENDSKPFHLNISINQPHNRIEPNHTFFIYLYGLIQVSMTSWTDAICCFYHSQIIPIPVNPANPGRRRLGVCKTCPKPLQSTKFHYFINRFAIFTQYPMYNLNNAYSVVSIPTSSALKTVMIEYQ